VGQVQTSRTPVGEPHFGTRAKGVVLSELPVEP